MVAVVALIAGVNVIKSQKTIAMSDIALANVEALADEEWHDGNCNWVAQYTICDYVGYFEGCPCGSSGYSMR